LEITPSCVQLVANPVLGCNGNWRQNQGKAARSAQLSATVPEAPPDATGATGGTPFDAQGDLAGAATPASGSREHRKPHVPPLDAARDLLDTIIGRPGHVNDNGGTPVPYTTPDQEPTP
jgi:hypothetical protein